MEELFRVTIHFNKDYGYIEYNPTTKAIKVVLDNPVKRELVEKYLATKHFINRSQQGLRDFIKVEVVPTESLDMLKLALTRLWEQTGVLVDWSHPVTVK